MGSRFTRKSETSSNPAPGAYYNDSNAHRGPSISFSPRFKHKSETSANNVVVGPGSYSYVPSFGSNAPQYSMVGRPTRRFGGNGSGLG
jgi:hypothetical protein